MKTRNQAVRAAALAAVAVAMAVAMAAPAHASLRDGDWVMALRLGFGRARQAAAARSGGTYAVRQARASASFVHPLRDWTPGVLPAPVTSIIGEY